MAGNSRTFKGRPRGSSDSAIVHWVQVYLS
jgi:hypothetical protein